MTPTAVFRDREVLQNVSNRKDDGANDPSKVTRKSTITDEKWRELIFDYYGSKNKSISAFLKEKKAPREKFDSLWLNSGLKDLKQREKPLKAAITIYDSWIQEEQKKRTRKLSEDEWRSYILMYYNTKNTSVSKFLKNINMLRGRGMFNRRFTQSGLKELKSRNSSYEDAVAQYDSWCKVWRQEIAEKNRNNSFFRIYTDAVVDGENDPEVPSESLCKLGEDDHHGDEHESKPEDEGVGNGDDCDSITRPVVGDEEGGGDGDDRGDDLCTNTSPREKATAKLTPTAMKDIISEFYFADNIKLLPFLKEKGKLSHRTAISRHWNKSGLEEKKANARPIAEAMEAYEEWIQKQKQKKVIANKMNATQKILTEDLEKFLHCMIRNMALCGQGVGKKVLIGLVKQALQHWGAHKDRAISTKTIDRYLQKYDVECRIVKNIDPVRIAQVTPENRDAFFFRLDQVVGMIHEYDPTNCPWKSWKEVDSKNIYNMDEMGTDNTRHRDLMLIPSDVQQRLFQSTPEGDRINTHVTLAVFSKANGHYKDERAGLEGAPMPMIIHTDNSRRSNEQKTPDERRMALYDEDDGFVRLKPKYLEGFNQDNPLGITVRTSQNGSMTKELFLDAMLHFVKHLDADQGESGKYSFLLLDSHVSRWNPKALFTLFRNRVIPIFFPSHLSIVVQPQDNGVILFLHNCIEKASQLNRIGRAGTSIKNINEILEKGLLMFRDGERKKLLDHGSNSTTRSYRIPGIKPCDPFSIGWRENLNLYASFNAGFRMSEDDRLPNYGVRPKNKINCPEFSNVQIKMLQDAVPILARESDCETILDDPTAKCYVIANDVINNWIEKPSDERTVRPHATNAVERLALEHMEIVHIVTLEAAEDSLYLEENCRKQKLDAILYQTLPMETIQVKPKGTDANESWYKATKLRLDSNRWSVFDGNETSEVTTQELHDSWDIDLEYNMFQNDEVLRDKRQRSAVRRRREKSSIFEAIARGVAEEERDAELKQVYEKFMMQPDKSYAAFKMDVASSIQSPSNHTVKVNFCNEEKVVTVKAHGNNVSSMDQMVVLDSICDALFRVYKKSEVKKTSRRPGGKVCRTRRGSDGFVKVAQIDERHRLDLEKQQRVDEKAKAMKIDKCRRRLDILKSITFSERYPEFWCNDGSIDFQSKRVTKDILVVSFMSLFEVEGRTKLRTGKKSEIENKLKTINITKTRMEEMNNELMDELRKLEASGLDQSILNVADRETSEVEEDTSFMGASIHLDQSFADITDAETSVAEETGNETDDTEELLKGLKKVSFDDSAKNIHTFPPQDLSSPAPRRTSSNRRGNKQKGSEAANIPSIIPTKRRSSRARKGTWKVQDR